MQSSVNRHRHLEGGGWRVGGLGKAVDWTPNKTASQLPRAASERVIQTIYIYIHSIKSSDAIGRAQYISNGNGPLLSYKFDLFLTSIIQDF